MGKFLTGRIATVRHTLILPGFIPTSINELLSASVGKRHRLKKSDRELVAHYARQTRIPEATGPRLVSVTVTKPRGKLHDADNLLKSLLDSLVHCRLLIDDDAMHMELGRVSVERGPRRETVVVLSDLDCELEEERDARRAFVDLLEALEPLRPQLARLQDADEYATVLYLEGPQAKALALAVQRLEGKQ